MYTTMSWKSWASAVVAAVVIVGGTGWAEAAGPHGGGGHGGGGFHGGVSHAGFHGGVHQAGFHGGVHHAGFHGGFNHTAFHGGVHHGGFNHAAFHGGVHHAGFHNFGVHHGFDHRFHRNSFFFGFGLPYFYGSYWPYSYAAPYPYYYGYDWPYSYAAPYFNYYYPTVGGVALYDSLLTANPQVFSVRPFTDALPAPAYPWEPTYPYNGDPENLVPMPGKAPDPTSVPPGASPAEVRVVATPAPSPSIAYPAYGEALEQIPRILVPSVRQASRDVRLPR